MNRVVSNQEVYGFSLKVRDAETDTLYGILNATVSDWAQEGDSSSVIFNLDRTTEGQALAAKIRLGKFYKLQLAYKDRNGNIGFYSTVSIIKYTYYPTVSILGFNKQMTNADIGTYFGVYHNKTESTEKCYQYKFTLMNDALQVIETSGWCIHNSMNDTLTYESTDSYQFLWSFETNVKYYIQYSVKTNNNLLVNSPRYAVVATASIEPELDANLYSNLDYDNGCINVWLESYKVWNKTTKTYDQPRLAGMFALSRASSEQNFTIWTKIHYFQLSGQLPEGYIFQDFTVKQGETYRYAIQQYNTAGVYSRRIITDDVQANFEDAYLFDGIKQLRIRFNPKVSNFKTVVQENKKTTMGSQYPFFFRNGYVEYKEFPISGLISYMTDENEYFMNRVNDLKMPIDWQDNTDITDENLSYERRFKLGVLDWLNNGEIKLFRSPSEGNYIVRLMNVSLTPNDSLSRMIHTFTCQATEVDSFSPDKLSTYGFLSTEPNIPLQLRFGTIMLSDALENLIKLYEISGNADPVNAAIKKLSETDLMNGFSCQYIKFTDCMPGTQFLLENEVYEIGSTGQYEVSFDGGARGLYLKENTIKRNMPGVLNYGIFAVTSNKFDTVTEMTSSDRFYYSKGAIKTNPGGALSADTNWLDTVQDLKHSITRIYKMRFKTECEIVEVASLKELVERYNLEVYDQNEWSYIYNGYPIDQVPETIDVEIHIGDDEHGLVNTDYAKYYNLHLNLSGYVEDILFRLPNGDLWYFEYPAAANFGELTWRARLEHFSITDPKDFVTYPTYVQIGDKYFDIAETGELVVPLQEEIPSFINWGPGVDAEIWYQELTINYGVEEDTSVNTVPGLDNSLHNLKLLAEQAEKEYNACALDFIQLTTEESNKLYAKTISNEKLINLVQDSSFSTGPNFYTWINNKFYRLDEDDRASFADNNIWIPYMPGTNQDLNKYFTNFESDPWANGAMLTEYYNRMQQAKYGEKGFYDGLEQVLAIQEKELILNDD